MSQKDLTISDMQELQRELQKAFEDKWGKQKPEDAKSHLLYMIEEMGECISIIKKKGIKSILEDKDIRNHFLEEITDVQNYYIEVLNCLKITPEEFSNAYIEKHEHNMKRNYEKEIMKKNTKKNINNGGKNVNQKRLLRSIRSK